MLENCISILRRFVVFLTGRTDIDAASFSSLARFLLAAAALCYAYIAVTPLTGFDNYTYFLAQGHGDPLFEIVRGTWLFHLQNRFLPVLSISPYVSTLAYIFVLVLTVLTVATLWAERAFFSGFDKTICLLLLVFPYWVSQIYFPYYHYGYALCNFLPLAAIALVWHSQKPLKCLLALLLFVAGVAYYQGAVNTASSLGISTCILMLARTALSGGPLSPVIVRAARSFCLVAAGSAAYLLLHKAALIYTGIAVLTPGGYTVRFDGNILERFWMFKQALFGSPFLIPPAINAVYLVLLVLIVFLCCLRAVQKSRKLLLVLPLLLIAVFTPSSLALIQPSALYPRSIVGAAFLWALAFIVFDLFSNKRLSMPLSALAGIVIVFFVIRINYAWHIQELTVQRDIITAARINERLESVAQNTDAARPLPVSVIGCRSPAKQPWPTDFATMFGQSQLVCFGTRTLNAHVSALLRFAGGEIAIVPPQAHDEERVVGRAPWPAPDSVFKDEYGFALWLGGPSAASRQTMVAPGLAALAEGFGIRDEAYLKGVNPHRLKGDAWLYELAASGNGPWQTELPLERSLGHIESRTDLPQEPRFVRIGGWAFDLFTKQLPRRVIIVNAQEQVVGFAETGGKRSDLSEKVCPDAEYGGFTGYMLKGATPVGFRYPK